jgi:hypothetical protein
MVAMGVGWRRNTKKARKGGKEKWREGERFGFSLRKIASSDAILTVMPTTKLRTPGLG